MLMPDWIIPILTIVSGVLGPLITVQFLLHRENTGKLTEISSRIRRMDDDLAELQKITARATDHGDRIKRLEDVFLGRRS